MQNNLRWILMVAFTIIGILLLQALRTNVFTPKPTIDNATKKHHLEEFKTDNFNEQSMTINNEWLPLIPGTHWVYQGTTAEGNKIMPHRLEFTVTDLTKKIEGVRAAVAWVLDFSDNQLIEKEIAFFAQDKGGNVWYMGEYPEEYEEGKFVAAPTWIAGQQDARAGIMMWATPGLEKPSYFEGWGPAVDWSDYAKVDQTGQHTCVPLSCYEDVLVIAESSLAEPDIFQLKYYSRGVGNIAVSFKGEDKTQEMLELVEFKKLTPDELTEVRQEALALEKHAYEVSKDVYGNTKPAELTSGTEGQQEVNTK